MQPEREPRTANATTYKESAPALAVATCTYEQSADSPGRGVSVVRPRGECQAVLVRALR